MISKNLEKLCKIIGRDLAIIYKGDTLSALWPFTTNEAEFYIGEFFIRELYASISKLKNKGYSNEQIAALFGRPSKIAQYFALFHSANILKVGERKELAEDLLNFISFYRKDPFCSDRTNILKSKIFDARLLNLYLESNAKAVEIGNKISALLLLYLESLYPTAMRLGHEFHGPYMKGKKFLFIKEFYGIKPKYLKFTKPFTFENIIIVEETEGKPQIDFFNHLLYMPKRNAIAILVDGRQIAPEEFKEILEIIKRDIEKINSFCLNFEKRDWLKVLAMGYFYSIEQLKKELNEKIKIPRHLFHKINKEKFFFDVVKAKESISNSSLKELEKKITHSFQKIFENE